jgi:hypothetical protein
MDNIKIVRFKNGDDVICTLSSIEENLYLMEDPMTVSVHTDIKNNKQILILAHWLPVNITKTNDAVIEKTDVMTIYSPSEDFEEYYMNNVKETKEDKKAKEDITELFDDYDDIVEAMSEKELQKNIH